MSRPPQPRAGVATTMLLANRRSEPDDLRRASRASSERRADRTARVLRRAEEHRMDAPCQGVSQPPPRSGRSTHELPNAILAQTGGLEIHRGSERGATLPPRKRQPVCPRLK